MVSLQAVRFILVLRSWFLHALSRYNANSLGAKHKNLASVSLNVGSLVGVSEKPVFGRRSPLRVA